MKLFNSAVIIACSLAVMASSASSTPNCGTDGKTLIVGTQFGIPPYDTLSSAKVPSGFDVDIACQLRKYIGFDDVKFTAVVPNNDAAIASNAVTMVISPLTELNTNTTSLTTEAFIKYADFSFGLLFNGSVPAGYDATNALANLAAATDVVGYIVNSNEGQIYTDVGGPVVAYPDLATAITALKGGFIAAIFSSSAIVNNASTNDSALASLEDVVLPSGTLFDQFRATGIGIAVNPACCQLYVDIKQALADMLADGTYAAIAKKNDVPTTFTPEDFTPASCANTQPNLPQRNAISSFIFDKYCPCDPTVISVSIPIAPVVRAAARS